MDRAQIQRLHDELRLHVTGLQHAVALHRGASGQLGAQALEARRGEIAEEARVEARERAEVEARAARFRAGRAGVDLTGRTVIVVDDGIATGGTARAALQVARAHGAARVVLAVPVGPADTLSELSADADEVVCLESPEPFFAIGQWYGDFSQVADADVVALQEVLSPVRAFDVHGHLREASGLHLSKKDET